MSLFDQVSVFPSLALQHTLGETACGSLLASQRSNVWVLRKSCVLFGLGVVVVVGCSAHSLTQSFCHPCFCFTPLAQTTFSSTRMTPLRQHREWDPLLCCPLPQHSVTRETSTSASVACSCHSATSTMPLAPPSGPSRNGAYLCHALGSHFQSISAFPLTRLPRASGTPRRRTELPLQEVRIAFSFRFLLARTLQPVLVHQRGQLAPRTVTPPLPYAVNPSRSVTRLYCSDCSHHFMLREPSAISGQCT